MMRLELLFYMKTACILTMYFFFISCSCMMNFKDDLLWKSLVYIACVLVCSFLTRELRARTRVSCRFEVKNGTHSIGWFCKFFFLLWLMSVFDSFGRVINNRNGDLCCWEYWSGEKGALITLKCLKLNVFHPWILNITCLPNSLLSDAVYISFMSSMPIIFNIYMQAND